MQLWSYKFTRNSNLINKKSEYYKLKKYMKFGDIEIEKQKFHHKRPVSMKNIDINKIVVSNKVSFGKKIFRYFIGYTDI